MIQKAWKAWSQFWFGSVPLLNLAVFRIVFASIMALMYLNRQRDVSLFYTDQGILPKNLALSVMNPGIRPSFLLSVWPDAWVPWMHALYVLLLLAIAAGAWVRFVGPLALLLQLSFLFRNYSVAFGADQIGTIFLLYLVFTKSDARLSVRSWWRNRKSLPELTGDALTSTLFRMIQIQLCVIYVYSGMEKLKGMTWWDGTAVWSVFANSQMVIADLTWVRHFPLLIVFITFSTILFELYFPVLVWFQSWRKYFLAGGILFHAGIGVLMALWSFAVIMICPYILFFSEASVQKALNRIWKRVPVSN